MYSIDRKIVGELRVGEQIEVIMVEGEHIIVDSIQQAERYNGSIDQAFVVAPDDDGRLSREARIDTNPRHRH